MTPGLHPAENRAYRELYAFSRQLIEHWRSLAALVGAGSDTAVTLERGAVAAGELLEDLRSLTAGYDLHGEPAAQGAGAGIARQREALRDRFLERNQALRFAVEDVVHVNTLLAYLERLAQVRGDTRAAEFCGRWERKMRRHESAARKAAAALGADPDSAVEPLHPSALGRLAHGVGYVVGSAGEWFDRRAARTRGGS